MSENIAHAKPPFLLAKKLKLTEGELQDPIGIRCLIIKDENRNAIQTKTCSVETWTA
jgi:hypothetical protein